MKYGICPNFWNDNPAIIPSGNTTTMDVGPPLSLYPSDMQDWLMSLYTMDQVSAGEEPYRRSYTFSHDCNTRCLQHRFNGKASGAGSIIGANAPDEPTHGAELIVLPRYIPSFVSMGVLISAGVIQITSYHRLNPDWIYCIEWMDNNTQKQCHGIRVIVSNIALNLYTISIDGDLTNPFSATDSALPTTYPTDIMLVQGDVRENEIKNLRVSIAVPEYTRSTTSIIGKTDIPPVLYDSVYTTLVSEGISPENVALRLMELTNVRFQDWALTLGRGWYWHRTFDGFNIVPAVPEPNMETASYFSQSGDLTNPKDNCVIGEAYYAAQRSVIAQIGSGSGNFYIIHNSISYGPFTHGDDAADIQAALSVMSGGSQITVERIADGSNYVYIITWFGFGITKQTITIDEGAYTGTITQSAMVVDVVGGSDSGSWAFIYADENVGTFAYDETASTIESTLQAISGGAFTNASVSRLGAAGSYRYLIYCPDFGLNGTIPLRVNLKAFSGNIYLSPCDILQINGYVIPKVQARDGAMTVAWYGDIPGARSALLITDIADSGGGFPIVSKVTNDMFNAGWGSDAVLPMPTGDSIVVDFLWSLPIHFWAEKDMQCNYIYHTETGVNKHITTFGTVVTENNIENYNYAYYIDLFDQRLLRTGTVTETGIYSLIVECDQEIDFKGDEVMIGWPNSYIDIRTDPTAYLGTNDFVASGNAIYNAFSNYNQPFNISITGDPPRTCILTYWLPYDTITLPDVGSQVYLLNHGFYGSVAEASEICQSAGSIITLGDSTTDSLGLDYHDPGNDSNTEAEIIGWDNAKRELYCNSGTISATHIPEKLWMFEAIINVRDSNVGQNIIIDNGVYAENESVLDDYRSDILSEPWIYRIPGLLKQGTCTEGITIQSCMWQEPGDTGRVIDTTFDGEYNRTPRFIPFVENDIHAPYIGSSGAFIIEKMRVINYEGGTLLASQYLPKQIPTGTTTIAEYNALVYDHDQRLSIAPAYVSGVGLVWPTTGNFELTFNGNSTTIEYDATTAQVIAAIEGLYNISSGTVTVIHGKPAYTNGDNWPSGYITIHQEPYYNQLYQLTNDTLNSGEVILNGESHTQYCATCSTYCPNCFRGIPPTCVDMTISGVVYDGVGASPSGTYSLGLNSFSSPACTFQVMGTANKNCCLTGAPWNFVQLQVSYNPICGYYYSLYVSDEDEEISSPTVLFEDIYLLTTDKPVCTNMDIGWGAVDFGALPIWAPMTAYTQNTYIDATTVGYAYYKCISPTGHISSSTFDSDLSQWIEVLRDPNWYSATINLIANPKTDDPRGGESVTTCRQTYFDEYRCYRCLDGRAPKYVIITVDVYIWVSDEPPPGGGYYEHYGGPFNFCAKQITNRYGLNCACLWQWVSGSQEATVGLDQGVILSMGDITVQDMQPTCSTDCCLSYEEYIYGYGEGLDTLKVTAGITFCFHDSVEAVCSGCGYT